MIYIYMMNKYGNRTVVINNNNLIMINQTYQVLFDTLRVIMCMLKHYIHIMDTGSTVETGRCDM